MNTMLRWSPTRKFHFHHDVDDMFLRFVDGAQVEAKYANGMLEVRIPAPRAAVPRMIEVKAA